ncbi:diguanylate cyclase [Bacteroidetes bacterium UKL13-3]|nr:diguanylate cyclase [Bacteroidetes bacterium UKL13-3]HCP94924.1 diguanylate cyclase [Bacteroidota bacterium]
MHSIEINTYSGKDGIYQSLLPQLQALCSGEDNLTANLANISAALKETFNWWWVGFYLVQHNELIVGPFQGSVACTRISFGKGVCGTSWEKQQTIIVPNVDEFPGHIACNSASKSEIVVPIIKNGTVVAVLDADSEFLAHYDSLDQLYLEQMAEFIATLF